MTGREELERRVDELAERYSGQAFADEIAALHSSLAASDRELLEAILLERAASVEDAVLKRVDARGWLRRQWDKASGRP